MQCVLTVCITLLLALVNLELSLPADAECDTDDDSDDGDDDHNHKGDIHIVPVYAIFNNLFWLRRRDDRRLRLRLWFRLDHKFAS